MKFTKSLQCVWSWLLFEEKIELPTGKAASFSRMVLIIESYKILSWKVARTQRQRLRECHWFWPFTILRVAIIDDICATFQQSYRTPSHSRIGHYFFSYLLTWEVDLIEILEIMPQMWQYVIFLSLKPTKVTSDFILN